MGSALAALGNNPAVAMSNPQQGAAVGPLLTGINPNAQVMGPIQYPNNNTTAPDNRSLAEIERQAQKTGLGIPLGPTGRAQASPLWNWVTNAPLDDYSNIGQIPTTGLIGSESVQNTALTGSLNLLQSGANTARTDLLGGNTNARRDLNAGQGLAVGALDQGFSRGRNALETQTQIGITGNNRRQIRVQDDLAQLRTDVTNPINQFVGAGYDAQQQQAALIGALGPEAQQQAIQAFQNSPGQDFLREEQERAIVRNASATGGLGGGNVLEELQRRAAGRASQQFDTRVGQLGDLSTQGLNAANFSGVLGGQIGTARGELFSTAALETLKTRARLGEGLAGSFEAQGTAGSRVFTDTARNLADTSISTGASLAGVAQDTGAAASRLVTDVAKTKAADRLGVGEEKSRIIANLTAAMAGLDTAEAAEISRLTGMSASALSNLMLAASNGDAAALQQLGVVLANISSAQASQSAAQPGIPGVDTTAGMSENIGKVISAIAEIMNIAGDDNGT